MTDRDWIIEEQKYIVADLESKVRAGIGTPEDRKILADRLAFYKSELEAV